MKMQFGALLLAALGTAHAGDPADTSRFLEGQACFRCDLRYESAVGISLRDADLRGAYMFNINLSGARPTWSARTCRARSWAAPRCPTPT
jgi:uncharacterized protein YjbI with pentapeptide repeats